VLAGLGVVVSHRPVLPGEAAIVEAAVAVPTILGWPFRLVMQLGTLVAGLLVTAGVAWWRRRQGVLGPAAVLLAVVVAYRLDNVVKEVVERPRPYVALPGLHERERVASFAYPSGHTTMAVAVAGALHPILPRRARIVAWVLATVVAVTRMHVGAHWPTDLVGGAALGLAIAAASWLVVDRLPACWFAPPERIEGGGPDH
jgi:undecaprenyl-diphosphatase